MVQLRKWAILSAYLTIIVLQVSCVRVMAMGASEQAALYSVMEAMAGSSIDWREVHPEPCREDVWPGLVCELGGDGLYHVTRLDFGYRPNPPCRPSASIPPDIAKLTHLRSLFIFECFSTLNTTVPIFLIKLAPTLRELSLRSNAALVGAIPIELASLSALQLLSLSQNGLSGQIPTQFSKLSALQHLDLSDNRLSGELPHELGSLHDLVILDLSGNLLTGRIPPLLGNLASLQKLDLSSNSLQGMLPVQLGRMRQLQFLALDGNNITGPYPPQIASLQKLQYLILDNNPMNTTLPSFIGGYKSLMALSLSNSGHYGAIPEKYGELRSLTMLSLERNKLTGSIPTGIGALTHLYQLNLSINNLSGAIPFTQEFARKLGRNLDLSGNTGLCSNWAVAQWVSKPAEGLPLCSASSSPSSASSDPKMSSLSASFSAPILQSNMLMSLSSGAFCILDVLILLHFISN